LGGSVSRSRTDLATARGALAMARDFLSTATQLVSMPPDVFSISPEKLAPSRQKVSTTRPTEGVCNLLKLRTFLCRNCMAQYARSEIPRDFSAPREKLGDFITENV
jgi:hypothetical protein